MTVGICTNLPSQCSKAAAKELIPMPSSDTVCPECGSRLQKQAEKRAVSAGALISGGVALVALLAVVWLALNLFKGGDKGGAPTPGRIEIAAPTLGGGGDYALRLSGSNTVGAQMAPDLVKAWLQSKGATDVREEPRAGKPETVVSGRLDGKTIRVEVRAHGTGTAFTDLESGAADVGMASRPIKDPEAQSLGKFGDMRGVASEHVLGLDGIAIVVPVSNSVAKLSRKDLQRLFDGEVKNWSELGGPDTPVHLYARDDKSGTYDTFKELVLRGESLATAERFEDSAQLEAAVARDPGGLGFVGLPYVKTTRAVPVSDGSSSPLEPTSFSIKTENYPLSRRLYLYTAATSTNPNVREFVDYALSAAGQKVVRAAHFVDLDLTDRVVAPSRQAAGDCRLSDRFSGDRSEYCRLRDGAEQLGTSFRFRIGSSDLDSRAARDLRRVLERMEASPNRSVILAGFADASGGYDANCTLSKSRAQAVASALGTLGLRAEQVIGFCSELPVRSNDTSDGREQNRRVEIFLK